MASAVIGKADVVKSVVPTKLVNNDDIESSAESVEGRLSANGNAQQTASSRTPSRVKHESRGLEVFVTLLAIAARFVLRLVIQ